MGKGCLCLASLVYWLDWKSGGGLGDTQATGRPRKAEPHLLMIGHGLGQRHTARFSLSTGSTEANTLRTLSILTLL